MESKEELLSILSVLLDNVNELEDWSVRNDDSYLELIEGVKAAVKLIKSDYLMEL